MKAIQEKNCSPIENPIFRVALPFPERISLFPQLRYMGSKYRLLPWIHEITKQLDFKSVLDVFSGSGSVSYLFKSMDKRVVSNDFLRFSKTVAKATIENDYNTIDSIALKKLTTKTSHQNFIAKTFKGIFYDKPDLRFLDLIWSNLPRLQNEYLEALTLSALFRSCLKKQPRGVFTISGNLDHYNDGRRDLALSIEEHFYEQVEVFNKAVFSNKKKNQALCGDVFSLDGINVDLVYMDPPYVPRSDDNCYIKRYHFLEGLSCYWEGLKILENTKVKKIEKSFTPFSYRHSAIKAFDRMFDQFKKSILVLSYSSNGYPDLDILTELMRKYKKRVTVYYKDHRYHFGTHKAVKRAEVQEYLIIGE